MSLAALLLVGCTGGGDDDLLEVDAAQEPQPEETEDPEPEPEETEDPEPEPEDPYAVPDEIDEAYVERVINAILEVQSEVLRGALQQQQGENLSEDLMALHFATTDGEQRLLGIDYLQGFIDDPSTREGLRDAADIEDMTFAVDQLLHTESDRCVIAAGHWDTSGTSTFPVDADERVAFSLSRVPEDAERSEGNPTPWSWRSHVLLTDAEGEPIAPEQWDDLDFDGHLDHSCEEFTG
jgi:hypothetical protein